MSDEDGIEASWDDDHGEPEVVYFCRRCFRGLALDLKYCGDCQPLEDEQ